MSTTELPKQLQDIVDDAPKGLFIDNDFLDAEGGETFTVYNPSTGAALAEVASASAADARRALDSVVAAQDEWRHTTARERSEILYRVYEILEDNAEELAYLQSLELGRALHDSIGESHNAAEFFRWFAEEAVRVRGDYRHAPNGSARVIVRQEPVGPSLAITPWNFPLAMGARKLAPAIAAGCTMLLKPASKTPLTALYLARVLREAGVPKGAVAVVPTKNANNVSDLLADDRIRKFTFTGSTEVGQKLSAKAAEKSMRISMELGGNAPYVVLKDADLDVAVDAIATAKMRGAGQVCIAANRFLVHSSLKDEFLSRVTEKLRGYALGPGYEKDSDYGPVSGTDQVEKISSLVDEAVEAGAKRHLGGELPEGLPGEGYYYPATVLSDIPEDAAIRTTEIFGPVVALETFDDDEEAIRKANDTPFGLASYLFSTDLTHALDVAERLESGMVAVNKGALSDPAAPFGGIKQSGIGREGGFEGIHEFLEPKLISLPL
ncbi:NAD-dependent succinate-semialdehyde dehydrogenase [Corynebacterium otitidis]|uniref:Succinate-semialdehyde dehydrogenase (NADP+) n=1 Tax=Corynebacterium otitidis ATCC 51513 TaxID=883169 RepID=I7LBN3_9CORY|nr:NAD-dependent succinate-semialdehyde dehydrogenase [Corynebacterium otitidis]EJZ82021.1 hypothetical protein HMPREF9719_01051 [Corynebacterium otitidis ATCC 51513]CCI83244.1 succinate-semialdehyde dehydrogenase (NADP+) [Corynebacterium otitidis ATCC 51513]